MPNGNPTLNRIVRQAIYELKKIYGAPISVYRLTTGATDYESGAKTATKAVVDIRKAAVLPASEARKFLTSISFISQSKSFVSSGMQGWDQEMRGFVIDARDIPGFDFQPEDWIVYRNKRYEVSVSEKLEFDTGWFIVAKHAKGSQPEQDINLSVTSTLQVEQTESEVVE